MEPEADRVRGRPQVRGQKEINVVKQAHAINGHGGGRRQDREGGCRLNEAGKLKKQLEHQGASVEGDAEDSIPSPVDEPMIASSAP